jgi:hypothetical protein
MNVIEIAAKAVQTYAEMHPRPSQVTLTQAAEMLDRSVPTVRKMVAEGKLKLNDCGKIPIFEIDRALSV